MLHHLREVVEMMKFFEEDLVLAIDPIGCECEKCANGEHVAFDKAPAKHLKRLVNEELANNTGYRTIEEVLDAICSFDTYSEKYYAVTRFLVSNDKEMKDNIERYERKRQIGRFSPMTQEEYDIQAETALDEFSCAEYY